MNGTRPQFQKWNRGFSFGIIKEIVGESEEGYDFLLPNSVSVPSRVAVIIISASAIYATLKKVKMLGAMFWSIYDAK